MGAATALLPQMEAGELSSDSKLSEQAVQALVRETGATEQQIREII